MSKIYYDNTKLTEKSVLADDDYFLVNDSETSNDETKFIYKKDLANQMGVGNFVKIAGDTMTGTLVGEIASGAGTTTPSFKSTSKDNATDYFQIGNATGASGKFIPNFGGKSDTTGIASPAGAGEVPASYWSVQTNDNVVTPALVFDARDYTNTGALATRHLFGVSSYNVMKWTTLPDGRLRYAQTNTFDNDNDLVNKKYVDAFAVLSANTGNTYYISDTEATDTWSAGKKNFKTISGFIAQLDTNITRYYTRSGTTTNNSVTITTTDTSNLKKGDRVTGTGIPYDSFVQTIIDNTSFTINNTCTANGTITVTNWVGIWVEMIGKHEVTASITNLDGVYFKNEKANVVYGNFSLFNQTSSRVTPFILIGGNYIGTGTASRLYFKYTGVTEYGDDFIKDINATSKCTSELISCWQNSGRMLSIQNCNLRANSGKVLVSSHTNTIINGGYRYGLLGGVQVYGNKYYATGQLETPVAIDAYYIANSNGYVLSDEQIIGCINNAASHVNLIFNGNIKGNTITAGGDGESHQFNGIVDVTTINITGSAHFNVISYTNALNCNDSYNRSPVTVNKIMGNSVTTSNYAHVIINTLDRTDTSCTLTSKNNSVIELKGYLVGTTIVILKTQNSGTIKILGKYLCQISENAGTIICERGATLTSYRKAASSSGNIIVRGLLDFYRDTTESASTTPTLPLTTNGRLRIEAGGEIYCQYADSLSGVVQKLADNTKVEVEGFGKIRVSNNLSPIQILSNAGTSQDIHIAQANTNCNGTTYGIKIIFADTTYGTAYAPNDVLNSSFIFENTLLP